MKKCRTCGEQFENKFVFCPLDGKLLIDSVHAPEPREFRVTLIDDARLSRRLLSELRFWLWQMRETWPSFRKSPIAFTQAQLVALGRKAKFAVTQPHAVSSLVTATMLLAILISAVLFLERRSAVKVGSADDDLDGSVLTTIDLNKIQSTSGTGIGAGDNGRVGFDKGSGEGSGPMQARSHGGGSGGTRDPLPASQGRPPVPSVIPAPIPTTYAKLPPQALNTAGIDIDPVLWKALPFPNYGDPRSTSTVASNGRGDGGGVGTNKGTGIGEGDGSGFGPGRKGNIGGDENTPGCCGKAGSRGNNPNGDIDRIYRQPEVDVRARVLSKPEPQYTEEARRNQITGTVILSVIFSRNGQVTSIRVMQTLCCGLTEKAIAAARKIQFIPATKNGQPVSTYMQLEYNFNLY